MSSIWEVKKLAENNMPVWAEKLIAAHLCVTDKVSHSERLASERYFVWQEEGENNLVASNGTAEKVVTGSTDLFTKFEFDPWAGQLEQAFDNAGISWYQNAVVYEKDTGLYHHEWVWEVLAEWRSK